jgi:hypothetical protein
LATHLGISRVERWLLGNGRARGPNARDLVAFVYRNLEMKTPRRQVDAWVRTIVGPRTVLIHVRGRPPADLPAIAPRCLDALKALVRAFVHEAPAPSIGRHRRPRT